MANTILNGWTINFVSAGLSGFSYNGAAAPKPIVNITADFGTAGPLDFVVSAASATDFLKVNYTYTIINDTGKNWVGFRIDYVDQIPPVPDFTEPAHPPYAHFHDNTAPTIIPGWTDPTITPFATYTGYFTTTGDLQNTNFFQNVPSFNGATEGRFSNGTFAAGAQQVWSGLGMHQEKANGSLDVVLTPVLALSSQDTAADGRIHGTPYDDVITGGAGNDRIVGSNGFDTIDGGGGNNTWDWSSLGSDVRAPTSVTVWLWAQYSAIAYAPNTFVQYNYLDASRNPIDQEQYDGVTNIQNVIGLTNGTNHLEGDTNANRLFGGSRADVLNGYGGADYLIGNGGADTFVLDNNALQSSTAASPLTATIGDYDQGGNLVYNAGEGDLIDLSALLASAYNHGAGQPVSSLVRAVEAPDGTVAALQIDTNGAAGGANWFTIAWLNGIHGGNDIKVILDSSLPAVTITAPVTEGSHDFNGDGRGDLLWRNINGQVVDWEFNGGALIGHNFGTVGNVWRIVDTGNFNGHGESDILWRNDNGQVVTWELNGNQATGTDYGSVPTSFHILNSDADFNGDGLNDILWRNDNGQVVTWELNGSHITNHDFGIVGKDWHVIGTADFNADGRSDLLWRNDSGQVVTWQFNGGQVTSNDFGIVSTSWHVLATADFNGDGKSDILWMSDWGRVNTWEMNGGGQVVAHDFGQLSNAWTVVGTGDFNGDGKTDILWRNNNGQVVTWEMNGAQVVSHDFGIVGNDWHVIATADFNGDGRTDIGWRNDSGQVVTWEMNGAVIGAAHDFGKVAGDWHFVT